MIKLKQQVSCLLIAMLSATISFSQSAGNKAIKGTPDMYQGYFVYDLKNNPDVDYWGLTIYELKHDNNAIDTILKERIIERTNSFSKIGYNYLKEGVGVLCVVNGYHANGSILTEDIWEKVPYGHEYWDEVCGGSCIGKSYAYRVKLNGKYIPGPYGSSTLEGTTHQIEVTGTAYSTIPESGFYTPYYRYMSGQEMLNLCGNFPTNNHPSNIHSPSHHGFQNGCPLTSDNHIGFGKLTGVVMADNLKNIDNTQLTGEVWRIQKTLGFWGGQSANNYVSDELTGYIETVCGSYSNSIGGLTNYANQHLSLVPDLLCNGHFSSNPPKEEADSKGKWITNYVYESKDKDKQLPPSRDLFGFLEAVSGNQGLQLFENNTGTPWWPSDSVLRLAIYKLDVATPNEDISNALFTAVRDSLFDEHGTPISTEFTMNPGLYMIDYMLTDGISFPLIFDVEEKTTFNYPLSNYLDVHIYPVPIQSNGEYSVELTASATVEVSYTVYDANGANVLNTQLKLPKGRTHTLSLAEPNLPNGILFHNFVLSDNSQIQFTTIKQ